MIISLSAIAGSDNYQYSLPKAGGQDNPWAVPRAPEPALGFQQPQKYQNQQYQGRSGQNRTYQRNRFVTPEFLESLKRQQSQLQMMPESRGGHRSAPEHTMPQWPGSSLPGTGAFDYPSYGLDYVDPLDETPVVKPWSPWDIGLDPW